MLSSLAKLIARWLPQPRLRIFISYRKDDSRTQALEIAEHLEARLDKSRVFMDRSLKVGENWRDELRKELLRSNMVWAIIGPTWSSASDKTGKPRLFADVDVLRDELELSLARGIPVVPIVLPGAVMPSPADLPPVLNELDFSRRQGRIVQHDESLTQVTEELLNQLIEQARNQRGREFVSWLRDYVLSVGLLAFTVLPMLVIAVVWPATRVLMALISAAVILSFPVWRFWRIYRLVLGARFLDASQGWLKAYVETWMCFRQAWGAPSIEMVARLRTEVALLHPAPAKPARQVDDDAYAADLANWVEERDRWRTAVTKILADALAALEANSYERPQFQVDTCFELNKAAEPIQRYLQLLRVYLPKPMPLGRLRDDKIQSGEFFSRIEIGQGFVSPQHLVAGLQDHFDEDWRPMLDWYGWAVSPEQCPLTDRLRKVQVFQFLCWLMWGPSIPHCTCSQWVSGRGRHGYHLVMQYGYGDEGNSWPLVQDAGDAEPLRIFMEDLLAMDPGSRGFQCRVVVIPTLPEQIAQRVCPAQRGTVAEAAMALRLRSIARFTGRQEASDDPSEPAASLHREASKQEENRRIYQAYVWIMFVLCDDQGRPLFPEEPWRGLLPFFTHGNIAESVTYSYVRQEVVDKALSCLRDLRQDAPGMTFRYACSSDDGYCGQPLQFAPAHPSMPELLADRLRARTEDDALQVVRMDAAGDDSDFRATYSACHLAELLEQFYESLESDDGDASRDTLKPTRR